MYFEFAGRPAYAQLKQALEPASTGRKYYG